MSIKKFLLTLILIVLSSTAWAMDDSLLDIESHIYKIKNKASGSCLSLVASKADKHNTLIEMDTQNEHTKYRLWYFEKTEEFFKVKSKFSGNCLSGIFETDKDRVIIETDAQDEQKNNRLWYIEKSGDFYKIKNKFSGTYLSSALGTANDSASLVQDVQDERTDYLLWYFEVAGELDKTRNKYSESCSDNCESKKVTGRKSMQEEQTKDTMWYAGGCGPCTTPTNAYAVGQSEDNLEIEIDQLTLLRTSFLDGAVYSLVPEIVRDVLVSKGYVGMSDAVATIVQGGMIVYHSPSYVAPISGMAVRIACSQFGLSPQTSATAGSTVAIAISLSEKLIFSQETILDSVVDVAIGVAGSYAGSTLALRAKSWFYGFWVRNKPIIVCEKSC